jgi:hexokinase
MFSENGRYLGLDLGSTNFRVVLVDLKDGVAETTTKYYNLTDDQLSGPAELVK